MPQGKGTLILYVALTIVKVQRFEVRSFEGFQKNLFFCRWCVCVGGEFIKMLMERSSLNWTILGSFLWSTVLGSFFKRS